MAGFIVGEPPSATNRLPVDIGGSIDLSGAQITGVASPALAEQLLIDAGSKQFVFRRTVRNADGTFTVDFHDILGNAVSPNTANLVLPLGLNGDGTLSAVGPGGLMTLSLSQYTAW